MAHTMLYARAAGASTRGVARCGPRSVAIVHTPCLCSLVPAAAAKQRGAGNTEQPPPNANRKSTTQRPSVSKQGVEEARLDAVLARVRAPRTAPPTGRGKPANSKGEQLTRETGTANSTSGRPAANSKARTQTSAAQAAGTAIRSKRSALAGNDSMGDLTQQEADRLFEEVERSMQASGCSEVLDNDMSWDNAGPDHTEASPSGRQHSDTGAEPFKGFGAPPRAAEGAAGGKKKGGRGQPTPSWPLDNAVNAEATVGDPLRIFLYAADAKATQAGLQAAGWQNKVVVTEDLRRAHAVVASKTTATGKHNKLQQGERTAWNAKVPFVCVGRRMSKENLVLALAPVLQAHLAKRGVIHQGAWEAAVKAAGVSEELIAQRQSVAAGKLQPGWRGRMLEDLGLMPASAEPPSEQAAEAVRAQVEQRKMAPVDGST